MNQFKWEEVLIYSVLTLAGSLAKYFYKLSKGVEFRMVTLIGDIFISSFAGMMTFLICTYFHVDLLLIGAACGISGWSGSRLVEELENKLIDKAKKGSPK